MFVGLLIGGWQNGYWGCRAASIRRGLVDCDLERQTKKFDFHCFPGVCLADRPTVAAVPYVAVPRYPHIQDAIDKGEVSLEARAISDARKSFCCCALGCAVLWG